MGNYVGPDEIAAGHHICINGPSPSGKAAGFGLAIPRFES